MDARPICTILVCLVTFFSVRGDGNRVALKIHGGSDAYPGMFPSIGYIVGSDGTNSCGATLISDEWAVSAAHCFSGFQPGDTVPVRVVFGEIDTSDVTDSHQESCFDVVIHEDYNDQTLDNDIALIRLKQPVNFTEFVKPVHISTTFADVATFRKCIVAGWGATEIDVYPEVLQFTEVKIQDASVCDDSALGLESVSESQSVYAPFNDDLMICAGSNISDACDGDSGGPLYCVDDLTQDQVLVGVVSAGQPNCTAGLQGIYTRLSAYTQWIEQNSGTDATVFSKSVLIFIIPCLGKLLSSI